MQQRGSQWVLTYVWLHAKCHWRTDLCQRPPSESTSVFTHNYPYIWISLESILSQEPALWGGYLELSTAQLLFLTSLCLGKVFLFSTPNVLQGPFLSYFLPLCWLVKACWRGYSGCFGRTKISFQVDSTVFCILLCQVTQKVTGILWVITSYSTWRWSFWFDKRGAIHFHYVSQPGGEVINKNFKKKTWPTGLVYSFKNGGGACIIG